MEPSEILPGELLKLLEKQKISIHHHPTVNQPNVEEFVLSMQFHARTHIAYQECQQPLEVVQGVITIRIRESIRDLADMLEEMANNLRIDE